MKLIETLASNDQFSKILLYAMVVTATILLLQIAWFVSEWLRLEHEKRQVLKQGYFYHRSNRDLARHKASKVKRFVLRHREKAIFAFAALIILTAIILLF